MLAFGCANMLRPRMLACGTMRFVTSIVVVRLAEYPSVVTRPSDASASIALTQDVTTDSVDDDVRVVATRDTTHAVSQFFQRRIDDLIESERLRLLCFRMIGRA